MYTHAPVYRVYVTSPSNPDHTVEIQPDALRYDLRVSDPGTLDCTLASLVPLWAQESHADNACQTNGKVLVRRAFRVAATDIDWTDDAEAVPVWRGYIPDGEHVLQEGEAVKAIGAISKLGYLLRCGASINGQALGALNTPTIDIDEVPMYRVESKALNKYFYAPKYNDGSGPESLAWLATSFIGIESTLGGGIDALTDTIELQYDAVDMALLGAFAFIIDEGNGDEEWCFCDGVLNDGSASGPAGELAYVLYNVVRGAYGSTAFAHDADSTVRVVRAKTIAGARGILLEKQAAAGSPIAGDWVPFSEFDPLPHDGGVGLYADVLGFTGTKGPWEPIIRGTYAVFEEESASAITYGYVLDKLLSESKDDGGPGWVNGVDYEIDAFLDTMAVARMEFEEPPANCWEAIEDLGGELGLQLRGTDSAFVVAEDMATGIVHFTFVQQKEDDVAADCTVRGTALIRRRRSLENVAGAIRVKFQQPLVDNLVSAKLSWHPDDGTAFGTGDNIVQWIAFLYGENGQEGASTTGDDHNGWQSEVSTPGNHQQRLELAFDEREDTGWALMGADKSDAHGDRNDFLVCPFDDYDDDGEPDLINVRKMEVLMDFAWTLNGIGGDSSTDGTMHFEVLGITGNPGVGLALYDNPPVYDGTAFFPDGNLVRLSGKLEFRAVSDPVDTGNMANFASVLLTADDIGQNLRGIVLRANGTSWSNKQIGGASTGSSPFTYAVRRIRVEGNKNSTVLVQVTDQTGTDLNTALLSPSLFRYAPLSYAKLRGHPDSVPLVEVIDAGIASRSVAVAQGHAALLSSLLSTSENDYECHGWVTQPVCGIDTLEIGDAGHFEDQAIVRAADRGLVQQLEVMVQPGENGLCTEKMTLTIIDYKGGLIGDESD